MKREEILAMEPGKELDTLIAERVMGWKKGGVGWDTNLTHWVAGFLCIHEVSKWSPSTDISAAWEVFEKFDTPFVKKNFDVNDEDYFLCKIGGDIVFGKTAPEAICKAALLAVLEEGETT